MDDTHEPLIRVMALHALAYCERLFYLEEVEEIRVADAAVYAGRTLHEELSKEEEDRGERVSLELASESLGLIGKADCFRRIDGQIFPYEHKRGRPRREGKTPAAWESDALQVAAYAMLLEESTGKPVTMARIRYHAERVTVTVPVDECARRSVIEAVRRARELRRCVERPPVAANDRLCIKCSLAPVCLPEEERLADDPSWSPVRLFPPDRELKTIHVCEPGAKVTRSGSTIKVVSSTNGDHQFPIHEVGALVLHGFAQITTQALHLCAEREIGIHFVTGGGRYVGGIQPSSGVHRRIRQYAALSDQDMCVSLARKLALAKVAGELGYVLRSTRGLNRNGTGISSAIQTLKSCLKNIAKTQAAEELRGHEGMAARAYFSAIPIVLREGVPEALQFNHRTRRPPKDRFNALLGFGYALLYQAVFQAVVAVGLEPSLGFFHTPRSAAYPLVLDLMELFRVPLWDMVLIGSINRMQWDPGEDFAIAPGRVWLSPSGRKKAIELFEKRLTESWKHPVISYSLSYARLIELEVRLLEKEWSGQPGLFARMRLR